SVELRRRRQPAGRSLHSFRRGSRQRPGPRAAKLLAISGRPSPSLCDQQDPGGSNDQEYGEEEERHEQPEPVKFGLSEIIASHKDDILAAALRRDHGKIAAREQQGESHQRRRHAPADAYVEKNTQ